MLSRLTTVLQSAVEALAPSVSRQEDFVYHWRIVTNYFIDHKHGKVPIEQTNIPSHLGAMLKLLVEEEAAVESGSTGPCMEYLLQHKLLETLYTLGRTDFPPGMKPAVLAFFTKLLSRIQQPILPHIHVHRAVHRLIKICGEIKAGPTEIEEVQFLCTVCSQLKMHPHLANFFLENAKATVILNNPPITTKKDFGLISSLLSLSHSEDGRVAVKACEGLMLCASLSESSAADCIANQTPFCPEMTNRLCQLYERLPRKIDAYDLESVRAKWGMDILTDRDDSTSFQGKRCVISFLSWLDYCDQLISVSNPVVATCLCDSIRRNFLEPIVEPSLLQASESGIVMSTLYVTQCLKSVQCPALVRVFIHFLLGDDIDVEKPYMFTHKLRQRLIDHCNHLSDEVTVATLKLFDALLTKNDVRIVSNLLLRNFIDKQYLLSSNNPHTNDIINDDGYSSTPNAEVSVPTDNVVNDAKNEYSEKKFTNENVSTDLNISNNCSSQNADFLSISDNEQSKLGDVSEMTDTSLADTNLADTNLADSSLADNLVNNISDLILSKELDELKSAVNMVQESHEQDTSPVPVYVADFSSVVNCFLSLVPEGAKSSFQSSESGYDIYLRDAHRQFTDYTAMCKQWSWPTTGDNKSLLSNTSEQTPFYVGHFLHMIYDKLTHMLTQSYEVNLQVSSVLAKLCLFPHPVLQEYLLNPYAKLQPDIRTPFTVLTKVALDIQHRMKNDPQIAAKLICARQKLMNGESGVRLPKSSSSNNKIRTEETCALEAIIVLEEFCKELAAIAFVKHHATVPAWGL